MAASRMNPLAVFLGLAAMAVAPRVGRVREGGATDPSSAPSPAFQRA